jgi:uncharacterized repeat protein (TIGR01451 family)
VAAVPLNPRRAEAAAVQRRSLLALALLASASTAHAQVFRTAPTFAAGAHPFALVAADLDGDQRIDLAVANGSSQDISILLGDGAGRFEAHGGPAGLDGLSSLTAGDLDRDGRTDLVVGIWSAARIYLGDGSGGFVPAASCGHGGALAVADVDGDQLPDLVGAAGNEAWVARGDGAGGCGAAVVYGSGLDASALATADLSGDGRPELLVADRGTHGLSVLRNRGDGSFEVAPPIALGAGTYPSDVVAADFDRDGRMDVAVAAPGRGEIVLLAGDGMGGLSVAQRVPLGAFVDAMAVADLDGGGGPDLLAADAGAGDVLLLRNDGTGRFLRPSGGVLAGRGACDLGVADLDGDGHADAVAARRGGAADQGGIAVLLGDGAGGFPAGAPTWLVDRHPSALAAADVDGDLRLDLVTANQVSGSLSLLRGTAAGFAPAESHGVSVDARDVAVSDFDGDGRLDLAATHFAGHGVSVLLGTGHGGFGAPTAFPAANGPVALDTSDLDGDGITDLAVVGWGQDAVAILLGDGRGGFRRVAEVPVGHEPHGVHATDLDRDGDADLAVANWGSGTVSVLLGDGIGGFAPAVTLPSGPQTAAVAAGDLDGDGLVDLLAANEALSEPTGSVSFWRGDGRGGFSSAQTHAVGRGSYALALADLDLDGHLDVATANAFDRTVSLLVGAAGGRLVRGADVPVGSAPTAIVARDLDGDARTDLVVTGTPAAQGRVLVLRNETPAADLSVTVDDGVLQVRPGDLVTYTITVTNRGPLAVASLFLHSTPAAALAYVAHSVSEGVYDLATAAWTGIDLQAGEQAVLTFTGRLDPMAVGELVQEATVSGPASFAEPTPADNSARDVDVIVAAADLALSVSATPDPVGFRDLLTYGVSATNRGPLAARDAVLEIRLPPALTFEPWPASPAGCTEAGGRVTCALGSLDAATTVVLQVRARANFALLASSVVSVASSTYDPDDDNGRAIVTTAILPRLGHELAHGYEARADAGGNGWFRLRQAPRSSYEIVIDEAPLSALRLEHVASDLHSALGQAAHVDGALRLRLRNATGEAVDTEAVRVASVGAPASGAAYRIRVYETTGRFPRFNNQGASATIAVLQNVGVEHVQGVLWFWDASGALLAVRPFELPPRGSGTFDTRESVAGRAGSITVTHDALHGDLAGKAVVVDPSGGFVSESALSLRSR